jgi:hypothetical protein
MAATPAPKRRGNMSPINEIEPITSAATAPLSVLVEGEVVVGLLTPGPDFIASPLGKSIPG